MVTVQLIDVERRAAGELLAALAPFVVFSRESSNGDFYNIELSMERLTFYALKREILFVANSDYTHELLYNEYRDLRITERGLCVMGKGEVKDMLLWRRVNRRSDYGNVHMMTLWISGMYVTQDSNLAALRAIASRTGGVYHINTAKGDLIEQGEYLYVEG